MSAHPAPPLTELFFQRSPSRYQPDFDTYRLVGDDEDTACVTGDGAAGRAPRPLSVQRSGAIVQSSWPLPSSLPRLDPEEQTVASMPLKQLQARLFHRFIVPSRDEADHLLYIDAKGFVVLMVISVAPDTGLLTPLTHPIHRISIHSPSQLPSAASLGSHLWLVHDGADDSTIKLLKAHEAETNALVTYERWLSSPVAEYPTPASLSRFGKVASLLSARFADSSKTQALILVQSTFVPSNEPSGPSHTRRDTEFNIALVRLRLPSSDERYLNARYGEDFEVLWILRGTDPLYQAIEIPGPLDDPISWYLLSAGTYELYKAPTLDASTHYAPAPRTGLGAGPTTSRAPQTQIQPAYTWAQTSDTVTVAFSLPTTLKRGDIHVHFSPPFGLSLSISASADVGPRVVQLSPGGSPALPWECVLATELQQGRYSNHKLWAPIDVEGSLWTWELVQGRKESSEYGVLTLFIAKKEEGTRWVQLFADPQPRHGKLTDDVLETLDPSDLLLALEGLDKYTSDELDEGPFTAPRAAPAQSTLLRDPLEDEDASIGRPLQVTKVTHFHPSVSPTLARSPEETMLALTIPGRASLPSPTGGPAFPVTKCLTITQGLDGAVFGMRPGQPEHVGHLPGLAYVLASKKDAQFVYTTLTCRSPAGKWAADNPGDAQAQLEPRAVALAFVSPPPSPLGGTRGAGTLFMYTAPPSKNGQPSPLGESRVMTLGHEDAGQLLDVVEFAPVQASSGTRPARALFCMSEEQLTIVQGLL